MSDETRGADLRGLSVIEWRIISLRIFSEKCSTSFTECSTSFEHPVDDIFEYFAEFPVEIERVGTIGVRVS